MKNNSVFSQTMPARCFSVLALLWFGSVISVLTAYSSKVNVQTMKSKVLNGELNGKIVAPKEDSISKNNIAALENSVSSSAPVWVNGSVKGSGEWEALSVIRKDLWIKAPEGSAGFFAAGSDQIKGNLDLGFSQVESLVHEMDAEDGRLEIVAFVDGIDEAASIEARQADTLSTLGLMRGIAFQKHFARKLLPLKAAAIMSMRFADERAWVDQECRNARACLLIRAEKKPNE